MPDQVTITEERQVLVLPDGVQTLTLLEESVALLEVATQGPPGPPGIAVAGSGDLHYTHTQNTPSTTWAVNHGLGKYPGVSVVDSAGTWVVGDVSYSDVNNLVVSFSAPFSGRAFVN